MNIVVIGSCTDSSTLARELNKRLNNSIIARIDLLKNIKQLILQGTSLKTSNALGTYVGDVETYDYSGIPETRKAQIIAAFNSIEQSVSKVAKDFEDGRGFLTGSFDALTNSLPTSTYSFIKVYSGVISEYNLRKIRRDNNFVTNSIVVIVKSPKDALLPISIPEKELTSLKTGAFASVEVETIEDVFASDVFKLLFELNNEPEKKAEPVAKSEPVPTPVFELHGNGLVPGIMEAFADAA